MADEPPANGRAMRKRRLRGVAGRRGGSLALAGLHGGSAATRRPSVLAAPADQGQPPAEYQREPTAGSRRTGRCQDPRRLVAAFSAATSLNALEEQVNPSNQTLKAAEARFRRGPRADPAQPLQPVPHHLGVALASPPIAASNTSPPALRTCEAIRQFPAARRFELRAGRLGPHPPLHRRRARRSPSHRRRSGNRALEPACRAGPRLF